MPTAGDQVPGGVTALSRRLAALEKEVQELRAARRLERASVGGGGLRVVQGGRFAMDTPSNIRMIDIGKIDNANFNNLDGSAQQAQFQRRADGSLFFACFSAPQIAGTDTQAWTYYDREGNTIFAEDTNSGQGLARPYLPVAMGPHADGGWDYWPRTASTTMAGLWEGRLYKQLPNVTVVVRTSMDTSGATGALELTINGVGQGTANVSFTIGYVTLGPYSLASFGHMAQIPITVQGRRVSGTGAIRATFHTAYNHN